MKKFILWMIICSLLVGCGTSKEKIFPHTGQTMKDVWNRSVGDINYSRQQLRRHIENDIMEIEIADHTRNAINEINSLFKRLPNPDLIMFVYPHLASDEEIPVPGYSTIFTFYNHVRYAMPGERTRTY